MEVIQKNWHRIDIQDLVSQVNLLDVISLNNERQYRSSRGTYKAGQCPNYTAHKNQDKHASCLVYPEYFYCTACNISGNVLTWLTDYVGMPFMDAIKELEGISGYKARPYDIAKVDQGRFTRQREVDIFTGDVLAEQENLPARLDLAIWRPRLDEYFTELIAYHFDIIQQRLWDINEGEDSVRFLEQNGVGYIEKEKRYCFGVFGWRLDDLYNVRKRRDDSCNDDQCKYIGLKGQNRKMLFGRRSLLSWAGQDYVDSDQYDLGTLLGSKEYFRGKHVYITFGEFDALVLQLLGYPAVSPTNGCSTWIDQWKDYLCWFDEVRISPDVGEERQALQLAQKFGSRARVLFWPRNRQGRTPRGFDVTRFFTNVRKAWHDLNYVNEDLSTEYNTMRHEWNKLWSGDTVFTPGGDIVRL